MLLLKVMSYPRSIIAALSYPIFLFFCSSYAIVQNLIFNSRSLDDKIIHFWAVASCRMFGVDVEVYGLENIPQDTGCVFLFNHTSFFDIFAVHGWLPSLRFGAKIELFKIPFMGVAMNRVGVLPIARHRRDEVFKVYRAAEERIARGERFALAPEGTRQSKERLGSFKSGPFVFAINAKAPIVPIVIRRAAAILPKGAFFPNMGVWKRTIRIDVLPAVSTAGMSVEQRPELQQQVHRMMQVYFPEVRT